MAPGRPVPFRLVAGTGGIGSGIFLELEGRPTLGRNESRMVRKRDYRDFCKLHIILHYVAVLLGRTVRVLPIGRVGDDEPGAALREMMRGCGMDVSRVGVTAGVPTLFSACFLYPDGAGGNLTTGDSASARVRPADIGRARAGFASARGRGIVVAAPEVPLAARMKLLMMGSAFGFLRAAALTTAEAGPAARVGMFRHADLVALNEDEARAVAGAGRGGDLRGILPRLARRLGTFNPAIRISVTAGERGAFGFAGGRWEHVPPCPARIVNTAGAGDAHLAGLVVSRAAGLPFLGGEGGSRRRFTDRPVTTALDFAGLLASLTTESRDTIHLSLDARMLRRHAGRAGARLSPQVAALLGGGKPGR